MSIKLLTRKEFSDGCLERDNHRCVFCGSTDGIHVHHIFERRLFDNGGYYLDNGASVCEFHHRQCEQTVISIDEVLEKCNIKKRVLPEHLYEDYQYDKWGNIILDNGTRLKGELFFDKSVQKILKEGNCLTLFSDKVKYPRTHHLPWSQGLTDDDRVIKNLDAFIGKRVIVTEKLDGENSSIGRNFYHARSLDTSPHESRNWIKTHWTSQKVIPNGLR